MPKKIFFSLFILVLAVSAFASGCSTNSAGQEQAFSMAPLHEMPREVQDAPASVREAYQFAAANPHIVEKLPCYCGCGPIGHESNYACYVKDVDANGKITYDAHALGCSICIEITIDAMRLLKDGKDIQSIRAYVDDTYSLYGPTNMPEGK